VQWVFEWRWRLESAFRPDYNASPPTVGRWDGEAVQAGLRARFAFVGAGKEGRAGC